MKIEKVEIANSYQIKLATRIPAGTTYQLRAECRFDCELIRAILEPWLVCWKEALLLNDDKIDCELDGSVWVNNFWSLDPVVRLIIVEGGPCLNEIRWFIDKLTDCHVAAETVNTRELYTGERIYDELDSLMKVPSTVMIKKAMKSLEERIDVFENVVVNAERAKHELFNELPLKK